MFDIDVVDIDVLDRWSDDVFINMGSIYHDWWFYWCGFIDGLIDGFIDVILLMVLCWMLFYLIGMYIDNKVIDGVTFFKGIELPTKEWDNRFKECIWFK